MKKELYIGLMSGTSLDGVDAALVAINDCSVELIAHYEHSIPEKLKQRILSVSHNQALTIQAFGELDHQLGHLFADAILALLNKTGYQACNITAIGSHGQTLFHQPTSSTPFTTQLGDANIIAIKTGILTVADFRRKDMALGGQGAPLVPAFHQALFVPKTSSIVVVNIGGIANITVLNPYRSVIGYDTGPGNMLMDAWTMQQWQQPFDKESQHAKQGHVNEALLTQLLTCDYFSIPAPKSTGRELFNIDWLNKQLGQLSNSADLSAEDIQATLCEFSAQTIIKEVAKFTLGDTPQLLVCGGGARNPQLMQRLNELLPDWAVETTSQQGVNSDYMEAMAFAWLARQCLYQRPSNLPEVTGASQRTSLGVIYPPATHISPFHSQPSKAKQ